MRCWFFVNGWSEVAGSSEILSYTATLKNTTDFKMASCGKDALNLPE